MSQFVLLVLRDGEPPRCVGPFALQRSAESMVELEQLREGEYLIQPLEPPTARHRLIPSPVPRDLLCLSCGKPFLPTHSIAAPGPTSRHPFKTVSGYRPSGSIEDDPVPDHVAYGVNALLRERDEQLGERGVRALYEQTPPPISPEGQAVAATLRRDLAAGGQPITQWVEEHADQLRCFVPQQLPERPKEIDQ